MRELEDQINSRRHSEAMSQQYNGSGAGALLFQGAIKRSLGVLNAIVSEKNTKEKFDSDSSINRDNYPLRLFDSSGISYASAVPNEGSNDASNIEPPAPVGAFTSSSSDNTSCELNDASSELNDASSELTDVSNDSPNNVRCALSPFVPIHKFFIPLSTNTAFLVGKEEKELCELENPFLRREYAFWGLSPNIDAENQRHCETSTMSIG